ncbi:MAG: hypothetical protein O3B41_00225 [Bacteroidetes bacterium]|nr:hypothetical protein [Bacteroidota bacterium]
MSEDIRMHPDAYLWLEKVASSVSADHLTKGKNPNASARERKDFEKASVYNWNPQTLKQICSQAMALGVASGHPNAVMKLLADNEIKLGRLRDRIGIDRKASPQHLIRATTLVLRQDSWISPGRWVPDILDRAAVFDPIHSSPKSVSGTSLSANSTHSPASSDRIVGVSDLQFGDLQHLILLLSPSDKPETSEITKRKTRELISDFPSVHVHLSQMPEKWLSSGPGVFDAVFEAAFLIHGIKD